MGSHFLWGQAAEADTQRVFEDYKWLVHINAFINQWSFSASVESMTRQPASQYEEDIIKICEWIERINTIPSYRLYLHTDVHYTLHQH